MIHDKLNWNELFLSRFIKSTRKIFEVTHLGFNWLGAVQQKLISSMKLVLIMYERIHINIWKWKFIKNSSKPLTSWSTDCVSCRDVWRHILRMMWNAIFLWQNFQNSFSINDAWRIIVNSPVVIIDFIFTHNFIVAFSNYPTRISYNRKNCVGPVILLYKWTKKLSKKP